MRLWKYLLDLWQQAFRRPTVVDRLAAGQPVENRRDLGELVLWSLVNQPERWGLEHGRLVHFSGMASVWPDGCMIHPGAVLGHTEALYLEQLIPAFDRHPDVVRERSAGRLVD